MADGRIDSVNRALRRESAWRVLGVCLAWMVAGSAWVCADEALGQTVRITGDRLSGFVLPVEPQAVDVRFSALRARAWTVDDTKRLMLWGDVTIEMGATGRSFTAESAAIWISRIGSEQGDITQLAMYFDQVNDSVRQSGAGVSAGPLLVTASVRGHVSLVAALMENDDSAGLARRERAVLDRGEKRLAEHLQRLASRSPPALMSKPRLMQPEKEPLFVPKPGGTVREEDLDLPTAIELPPAQGESRRPWLARPDTTLRFSADRVVLTRGEEENTIVIDGHIVVEFAEQRPGDEFPAALTVTAERAVMFTDPVALEPMGREVSTGVVRGMYLEGNVHAWAQDGTYAVRAPHMYYDFRTQQALMLEAMIRLQPRDVAVAVHARAKEMRQLSEAQWEARKVVISTSEFATPHLAIGADRMTIRQEAREGGGEARGASSETHFDSRGNTLRASGVPFFYWPRFSGKAADIALRSVEVGTRDNDGFRVLTEWDFFALVGGERPEGTEGRLLVDGFTERGAGLGARFEYDVAESEGALELYGLFDEGIDRTSSGREVEPDDPWRGYGLLEHQTDLTRYWSVQAQLALISDDSFMSSWREDDFTERREFESSLYLKHQRDTHALTVLGKYSFQDFLSNDYLLASRGYAVDKAPEVTYRRYGDSVLGDRLTYSGETRATRMRLAFQRRTPAEAGLRGSVFGIADDVPVSEALRASGLRENWVNRFDTRHELSMPMAMGVMKVTPFVVARLTAYDDDFASYTSDADEARYHGAAGVRVRAQFHATDNSVENRLLDMHRLRHLVEPYLTVWTATSSIEQEDLPVYDEEVESIADGTALQVGVRNTWQTQRGGPGHWRSVDWLTLDTSVVIGDEDSPDESPTPQFFEYRPEYSQFGDHVRATAIWAASDTLAVTADGTYVLDTSDIARGAAGVELRHSPVLTTYVEYRSIRVSENELLAIGWVYQLTPKYRVALSPQYDFREEDFRALSARLTRSFPDFDFTVQVRYDQIRDDTTLGATLGLVDF